MRERFEKGGDIKLRLMAAGALARKGDVKALAYIRECRDGKDPEGLQISAWLLGILGDKSDLPLLSKVQENCNYLATTESLTEILLIY